MRNYIILFFFGTLFLVACSSSTAVPANLIPKKQMIALMTQVHLADGTMYNYPQNPDTLYRHGMGKYLQLFKAFHTDTLQFKNSMIYYTAHADVMSDMYDQVIINLNNKSDSLNKVRRLHARADSIKNVIKFKRSQDSTKKVNAAKPQKK